MTAQRSEQALFAGTYTDGRAGGIFELAFNEEAGSLRIVREAGKAPNPRSSHSVDGISTPHTNWTIGATLPPMRSKATDRSSAAARALRRRMPGRASSPSTRTGAACTVRTTRADR